MSVPEYNPQNKLRKVSIAQPLAYVPPIPRISAKYQGMAIILIPCANPEIILAINNKPIAFYFHWVQKYYLWKDERQNIRCKNCE